MNSYIEKMIKVQSELKAPKNQYNSFGKYKYRSCEDIVEAVKPLLKEAGLYMYISDEIKLIGDRFYVEAKVTITDGKESSTVSAFAREALTKKGMDDSQITGSASSYARKYALNGMFGIDDTKDADATNTHDKQNNEAKTINKKQAEEIKKYCLIGDELNDLGKRMIKAYKINSIEELPENHFDSVIRRCKKQVAA